MEITEAIPQSIQSSSHIDYIVLKSVSIACGVEESDICSASKSAGSSRARGIFCIIMDELGFSNSEIQRMLGIEYRSVQRYISLKNERLENDVFKYCYEKSIDFVKNNNFDYSDVFSKITSLELKVLDMESKYQHLKQLLLNQ